MWNRIVDQSFNLIRTKVDANGCSWRSGAKVERKKLKQWFLRISKFKEALLGGLDYLGEDDRWPARVLSMQRNWLGRSEGATVKFRVKGEALEGDHVHPIQVFTTRPDTLFGVQYLALSVSHPVVSNLVERYTALKAFVDEAPSLPADSKVGFQIPGLYATNPLSNLQGMPSHVIEPLPVFVAPYVLSDYGEGAVMGVPGHDVRDNEFWRCNQGNERIRFVVSPSDSPDANQISASIDKIDNQIFTANGILTSLCGPFSGLSSEEGSRRIVSELASAGDHAMHTQTWKLRDWLISRQRYWGTPIPMIHCHECGTVPVPLKDLPVKLPKVDGAWFKSKTGNPLESAQDWVSTQCPTCGSSASRDTDTMDTFVDSSWYFMRFVDPHNHFQPFSPDEADSRLPVDIYIGGIEHAILHLLYARFISKFLAGTLLWPSGGGPENRGEPFRSLITQGMVHGKTYSDPHTSRFLRPEQVDLSDAEAPKIKATGETPTITWEKMSKSKYNGVEPTQFIQKYGADVTRAHILFQAPVSEILLWEESRIVGIQRWFSRLWRLVESAPPLAQTTTSLPKPSPLSSSEVHLYSTLQKTIASVTTSFSTSFTLNTTVSDLMSLTNAFAATCPISPELYHRTLSSLLRLLAPIAPAFAEECWDCLHNGQNLSATNILAQPWPVVEKEAEVKETYQSCAVMENGKLRFVVEIRAPSEELADEKLQEWVFDEVKGTEMGRRWLEDREKKQWKRVVIVKGGRVVNFVG